MTKTGAPQPAGALPEESVVEVVSKSGSDAEVVPVSAEESDEVAQDFAVPAPEVVLTAAGSEEPAASEDVPIPVPIVEAKVVNLQQTMYLSKHRARIVMKGHAS